MSDSDHEINPSDLRNIWGKRLFVNHTLGMLQSVSMHPRNLSHGITAHECVPYTGVASGTS